MSSLDAGFATLVYLGLLVLCVQQMEATRTPAGISSVSRLTFVFQSIMDAFSFTSVRALPLTAKQETNSWGHPARDVRSAYEE